MIDERKKTLFIAIVPAVISATCAIVLCYRYGGWYSVPLACATAVYILTFYFDYYIFIRTDYWPSLNLAEDIQKNKESARFTVLFGRVCWAASTFSFLVVAVGLAVFSILVIRRLDDTFFLILFLILSLTNATVFGFHSSFKELTDATKKIFDEKNIQKCIYLWKYISVFVGVFALIITIGASTSTMFLIMCEINHPEEKIGRYGILIEALVYMHSATLVVMLMNTYFTNYFPGTAIDDPKHRWRTVAATLTVYIGAVQTLLLIAAHFPVLVFIWWKVEDSVDIPFLTSGIAFLFPAMAGVFSAILSRPRNL